MWDSQQRIALCQPIRVMDVPQHRQTSMSRSHFAGIFSAFLFLACEMSPRVGLDSSPVCAVSPRSQAVCAGSWLAAGRDKMQKAEAVWLKYGANRGTIYHYRPAEQSESKPYLISYLLS